MNWKQAVLLLTSVSLVAGLAGAAEGQERRLGIGIDLTQYPTGSRYLPQITFFLGRVAVDVGMNVHAGENVTQYALRTAAGVRTTTLGPAELGFGGQFDLETEGLAGNTLTGLGGFVEAAIGVGQNAEIGLRGYPLMISFAKDYTRFAIMGVGFSMSFFVR